MPLFEPLNIDLLISKHDVKGLIRALNFKRNIAVRKAAAEALSDLKDIRAVKPLFTTVLKDHAMYHSCRSALVEMGAISVEQLIVSLKDREWEVRKNAIIILAEIKDPHAVEPLINVLNHDKVVRAEAARALGEIKDPRAGEPLISALKDSSMAVRKSACYSLGELKDPRAVKLLITFSKEKDSCLDPSLLMGIFKESYSREQLMAAAREDNRRGDDEVVRYAFGALAKIKDQRAVDSLINALDDWHTRNIAANALYEVGDTRAVEPLFNAAIKDTLANNDAWRVLVKFGAPAIEPLATAVTDDNWVVRLRAVAALGGIGDSRVVEPLIFSLKDSREEVRVHAALGLGQIKDARAVTPLTTALYDSDQAVCNAATHALEKIKGTRTL